MRTVRHRDDGPRSYRNRSRDVATARGDEIDVCLDTAEYLVKETGHFEYVGDPEPEAVCGVNGCSREVSDPSESCWQHESEE